MVDQDRVRHNWLDDIDAECLARAGAKSSPYPGVTRFPRAAGGDQFGIGGVDELEQAEKLRK